jgi:hypothetical protein
MGVKVDELTRSDLWRTRERTLWGFRENIKIIEFTNGELLISIYNFKHLEKLWKRI